MAFEPRQLVVVHEEIWKQLEDWAAAKNCRLFLIPDTPRDDFPSYALVHWAHYLSSPVPRFSVTRRVVGLLVLSSSVSWTLGMMVGIDGVLSSGAKVIGVSSQMDVTELAHWRYRIKALSNVDSKKELATAANRRSGEKL